MSNRSTPYPPNSFVIIVFGGVGGVGGTGGSASGAGSIVAFAAAAVRPGIGGRKCRSLRFRSVRRHLKLAHVWLCHDTIMQVIEIDRSKKINTLWRGLVEIDSGKGRKVMRAR